MCLRPRAAQGSLEKLSDEAVEDTLEKVVRLLAYISDKDLFAEFYRKKLARRLLFNTSASDDHERSILARLKQQCGAQFTSKARPTHAVSTSGNIRPRQGTSVAESGAFKPSCGRCTRVGPKQQWARTSRALPPPRSCCKHIDFNVAV